jgi:hypothetical protein
MRLSLIRLLSPGHFEQTRMSRRHSEFSSPPSPEDQRVFLDLKISPEYFALMKAGDLELKEIDDMR